MNKGITGMLTYDELVRELQAMNPHAKIKPGLYEMTIQSSVPLAQLYIPNGFNRCGTQGNCLKNDNFWSPVAVTVEPLMENLCTQKKTSLIDRIKSKVIAPHGKTM
ncbi:MAG: hypothetical protein J5580_03650 [Clostridia bacterium]|nr:hypothetical protein [Clostridia bacterium]